jgi:hypothetical protein
VKIRKEQREAFEARALELFPPRLRAFLAAQFPDRRRELEGGAGLERVEARVGDARERGFRGERDITLFVALGFVLGEGFASEPWAAQILRDEGIETPTERAEALWSAAKSRAMDGAAASLASALR